MIKEWHDMGDSTSSLKLLNYITDFVQFKNNPDFESDEVTVQFDVHPEFYINDEKGIMTVELQVEIFKDAIRNNYPFEMSVSVVGIFEMKSKDKEDNIHRFKTNAVAIMYPYIRALVSTYTANANVPPLILPVMNINKMIEESEKNKD